MALTLIGILLCLCVGAGCRWFDIPSPAPSSLTGTGILLLITLGYISADVLPLWGTDRVGEPVAMKVWLGFLVAYVLGFVSRALDLPAPAPPIISGALLAGAMTVGYVVVDRYAKRNPAQHSVNCGGPTGPATRTIKDGADELVKAATHQGTKSAAPTARSGRP